jgi:hypothetical protein
VTSTHRIDCPFPPCNAWWNVHFNVTQVPYHNLRGADVPEIFQRFKCPGSLTNFYIGTSNPLEPDVKRMQRGMQIYTQRVEEWRAAEKRRIERLRAENGDADEAPLIAPEGREAIDPTPGNPLYFPGRPADAPEPGPGEEPAQTVDKGNIAGHRLGRAEMEDAHATARALTILARDKMNETLTKLAGCGHALNGSVGLATMAEIEATAAQALVIAAVGTGSGKPAPAEQMAEQTALGVSTIMGTQGDNIFNAIEVARIRVELAAQQITAAIEQANQYIALLS